MKYGPEIINQLMNLKKVSKVKQTIDAFEFPIKWNYLSDTDNNATLIESAPSAAFLLPERVTNSQDAVLEYIKEKRNNLEDNKLISPRQAVEKWLGIKGGYLHNLSKAELEHSFKNTAITVELDESDTPKKPTWTFRDNGCGIHPTGLQDSIFSNLIGGKSAKRWLIGTFGWGGSKTFAFCSNIKHTLFDGWVPLAIIITRKQPELLKQNEKDMIGWSIVRAKWDKSLNKRVYEYLTDESNKIFTFNSNEITSFEPGLFLVHLEYDFKVNISVDWYNFLESYIFDPIVPYTVRDNINNVNRFMKGALSRLTQDEDENKEGKKVKESNLFELLFLNTSIPVRYWVFNRRTKSGTTHLGNILDRANSKNTIKLTFHGQTIHHFDKQAIREAGLHHLADYLLVQIEMDKAVMDIPNLITSQREILDTFKAQIKEEVIKNLSSDDTLKSLNEEYAKESAVNTDKEVVDAAHALMDKYISDRLHGGRKFKPKEPPTLLEFKSRGIISFIPGEIEVINLKTDAENDILDRGRDSAEIEIDVDPNTAKYYKLIKIGRPYEGNIKVEIMFLGDMPINTKGTISCRLKLKKSNKILGEDQKEFIITLPPPPPPPLVYNEPPTIFEIINNNIAVEVPKGKLSKVYIHCDAPNGYIQNNVNLTISIVPENAGVSYNAISSLKNQKMYIAIKTEDAAKIGQEGKIICELKLNDDQIYTTSRDFKIVREIIEKEGEGPGNQRPYQIIEVTRSHEKWQEFIWDEDCVANFIPTGNVTYIYLNMEYRGYINTFTSLEIAEQNKNNFKQQYLAKIGLFIYELSKNIKQSQTALATTLNESSEKESQKIYRAIATTILLGQCIRL